MIVRELLTRLGYAVNETQLNRYQAATNNIRQQADGAAEAFRNMFLAFAGFGAIKSIAKTADDMQSLEARIGMLPQTVTSAADAFDVVAQRATDARGSIDAYANFYIKLQHAGKDFIATQEEGLKITDTITKALVIGGATAQEQASTLLQFGQAIGSGVLQGDEFRALTESAPQLVDALSKQLGIARGDLKKYASEGKLTSKEVIKAVGAIANEFDEKFKQMPLTISQSTTIIGNRWSVFINKLNRESLAVTKIADFLLKGFDSIESGLKSMVDFLGGATNTLKAFGIVLAAVLAPFAVKLFAGALATLFSPIGLLIAGLALVGIAIDDFYGWMDGADSVFGDWFGNFDEAMKKLNEFSGWITLAKDAVIVAVGVMVANWIWAAGVAVWSAGQTAAAWITNMVRFGAAMAGNAIALAAWVASSIASLSVWLASWIATFASAAIAAAPLILTFTAIVAGIGLVIAAIYVLLDNWKLIFKTIKDIATGNWTAVADDFGKMVDRLKGYWNSFKSFFGLKTEPNIEIDKKKLEIKSRNENIASLEAQIEKINKESGGKQDYVERNAIADIRQKIIEEKTKISQIENISNEKNVLNVERSLFKPESITPSVVAGAASSSNGVPVSQRTSVSIVVNQTLPPGTPAETASAAQSAVTQAFNSIPQDRLARQLGQVQ